MDSINVDKIQALKKYKQQEFINSLMFYPLVALISVLFCSTPFWFPCLYSSTKTFFFVSIPKILTFFLNPKSLFILGNLIIVFLLKESKTKSSNSSKQRNLDDFRDAKEVVNMRQRALTSLIDERVVEVQNEVMEVEEGSEEGEEKIGNESEVFSDELLEENDEMEGFVCDEILTEDLNKRAEDFIAMVNKQIRLEANCEQVLLCTS
ncbi:hypothetical protein RND81_13G096400 [Saponaria officinalis]|uniref:DUF4408 domain-containing protein n=1 Tax=Saponaria officinalis TaxID=3572 RepID=A0AAW1GYY9_SAPOF